MLFRSPMRFGTQLQPRISIWNIDQSLVTQNLKLWNESLTRVPEEKHYRFTVITMCVRYARRLQVMLQAIAHQEGIELSDIEVIVAYLPDADPTDDILEDRKSTRLNSSHVVISYAVFRLKKKKN